MAAGADERTEPPTPRRRKEAREKGQVARSQDLTAAVLLLAGFLSLALLGPGLWFTMVAMVRTALTGDTPSGVADVLPFAAAAVTETLKRVVPFLLILFVAMVGTLVAQIGVLFTFHPLAPNLGKVNPISGVQRMFSIRSVMLAVINFGKLLVVALVAYIVVYKSLAAVVHAFTLEFADVFRLGSWLLLKLAIYLGAALLVLALLDYAWQRFRHVQDLKMTKEEVRDELRNMEGDPKIKHRQRQIQLQLATQRLRKNVPTADVVVTNPTHVAVAVRYDPETMAAPKVVAKGADEMALRIRRIAAEFKVPTVERPPLARALFEAVDVGQYVPERLYKAIAEVLAYVYELTGRSPVRTQTQMVGML
ncbi:MAG: flagellar biosynthesis protein FlhB [Phycisphaerae bacterium]|jgi:flagellar biosynthetic protein FlhB